MVLVMEINSVDGVEHVGFIDKTEFVSSSKDSASSYH
jgi:hypothetical protein